MKSLGERPLPDDYPVFPAYWYLVDGEPKRSPFFHKATVEELRTRLNAELICNCNASARELPLLGP